MSTKPLVVLGTLALNESQLAWVNVSSLWEAFVLSHEERKGVVAI